MRLAARTLLYERWRNRNAGASPFGVCLRLTDAPVPAALACDTELPFRAWAYRPAYLPDSLCMYVGEAGIEEPMWVYLSFLRRSDREKRFVAHPAGVREITGLTLITPAPLRSTASERIIADRVLCVRSGRDSLLEVEFDNGQGEKLVDFRPDLPIVFRL